MDFSLHALFAQTMDARLDYVKAIPQRILLAGGDGGHSRALLVKRYPAAHTDTIEPRAAFAAAESAAARKQRTWWQRLLRTDVSVTQQALSAPLPGQYYDWVWANLSLPAHNTAPVLTAWAKTLRETGMLFFTTFGSDTLREISALLPPSSVPRLPDMHDTGDELLRCGFADAVTDTEKRLLYYRSAQRFWQDMAMLGLDALLPADTAARHIIDTAITDGRLTHVTLEIVYGHAIKPQRRPETETFVHFYPTKPTFE